MTMASASASPARAAAPVRMCSPNKNTPSKLAASGSRIVNPGWESASGPDASACVASSIVAAPATRSTYGDQVVTRASMPSPRCELSSLMTAAMNPHEIPVADPSKGVQVDGIFGPETDTAVRDFQQALHLDIPSVAVDGIAGPVTWQALVSGMLSF